MKMIYFVRHAKSDWSIPGIDDFDRPLNQRGYSDAHRMGRFLKKNISGDLLFVSSPAIRALSTALIFATEINFPLNNIQLAKDLYEAETDDYEYVIGELDNRINSVLIFGHNPTISEVVAKCSRTSATELPTCAVSILRFQTNEWSAIYAADGEIAEQHFPKALTE
jgi:phosphohistidine phosphatase